MALSKKKPIPKRKRAIKVDEYKPSKKRNVKVSEIQKTEINITRIRYRDSQGRVTKFSPKKKLAMEVIIEQEIRATKGKHEGNLVLTEVVSRKYSTGLIWDKKGNAYIDLRKSAGIKKRKKEITLDDIRKKIIRTLEREKKPFLLKMIDGKIEITYLYEKREGKPRKYLNPKEKHLVKYYGKDRNKK